VASKLIENPTSIAIVKGRVSINMAVSPKARKLTIRASNLHE
jgi:hypothetical protein